MKTEFVGPLIIIIAVLGFAAFGLIKRKGKDKWVSRDVFEIEKKLLKPNIGTGKKEEFRSYLKSIGVTGTENDKMLALTEIDKHRVNT